MDLETLFVTYWESESTHHNYGDDCFLKDQLFEFHFSNIEWHVNKSSHETKSKKLSEWMLHLNALLQGCQTRSMLWAAFINLDFIRARLYSKNISAGKTVYQWSRNIFVCQHKKPVYQISQYTSHGIVCRSPLFRQRSPEIV